MSLTLQWLAGFFDGEGCITYNRNGNREAISVYPRITITNTYLPIMKAIQSQFGGTLHQYTPKYRKGIAKNCFVLVWQCRKAVDILQLIVPYLTVKKAQAELVIAGYDSLKRRGRKLSEEIIAKRAQLKTKLTELKRENYVQ